ncbi:MAG TPA: spore coat protein U domain-containing protein [Burkholderiales bacterium]|nr:spore coat protein U domain-containing protein [Burkholderiales bacterium]
MKRLVLGVALSAAALFAQVAQAQTFTSGQFNVAVTLTSVCTLSAIADVTFAYTSLQAVPANSTGGGYSVTCTNNLPYTFGLQAGTGAPSAPGNANITVTDANVGLQYTLTPSAANGTGSGAAQAYSINGTMPASQSGNCGAATCDNLGSANRRHTLIVDF